MRNLSAFKIIGAIGAERRAKGGALFHINVILSFLSSSHFHTRKTFILMLVTGVFQSLIIGTCFAWCPETSISKSRVSTARELPD